MNKYYFFFISIFLALECSAQLLKPIFKEDEFSGTFYQNSKDRLGYVWISTDQGVYRWDSKYLEHFTTADGLPSNEVFRCYMDSKERVWMTFYNGDICYYYRGKIYNKANDTILAKLAKLGKVYCNSIIEYNHTLYLSNLNGNVNKIDFKHKTIVLSKLDTIKYFNHKIESHLVLIQGTVCASYGDSIYKLNTEKVYKIKHNSNENQFYLHTKDGQSYLTTYSHRDLLLLKNHAYQVVDTNIDYINSILVGIKGDNPYILRNKQLYFIQNGKKHLLLVDSLLEYNNCFSSEPALFLNNKIPQAFSTSLEKIEIVKRLQSNSEFNALFIHNKQIWNYTQGQGLYNITTKQRVSFPNNAGKFYNLVKEDNKLAIIHAFDFYILDMNSGRKSFPNQNFLSYDSNQKKTITIKNTGFKHGFWKNQSLYISSLHGLYQLSSSRRIYLIYNQRVNSSYLDHNGRFWLSKLEGLYYTYQFEPKIDKLVKINTQTTVSVQALDYKEDGRGNLLLATNDGVYIVSKNNQVFKIQTQHGLTSNDCKKIYLDSDGSLWIATNNGVNHFRYWKNGKFTTQRINYFLKTDGLQSDNIRDLAILEDSLYIISDKGLDLVVNKHWRQPPSQLPIHINRLYITGQKLDSFQFPQLKNNQNSLQIDFSVIYYDRTDRLKILYRLIADGDTTVQELQDRTILLQSLAPNDYKLQIYAYDQDYPDSIRSAYKEVRIHILPPFYKTWWFFSLIFLTVLGIAGWIIYLNFKRKNDQLENDNMRLNLEKDLSKFKLEALKAEMNPHFIFNCLNSIKNYILQSNIEKSQYYLSQLSKLIRIALYNTKEEFISLRSELEFIDLYVELEQLRYDHKFNFEKNITDEELLNAEIPTMVLQPFFENAVRHGKIGQLEGRLGKLKLEIKEENGFIVFRISDNGIGIEEAQKIKTESNISHKSMALDIIKERIAIYNQSYELDMQLKIESSSEKDFTTVIEIRYILD